MWKYNYTDELYHYGVKGMKWGHRKKYYNSDGSLNKLGQTVIDTCGDVERHVFLHTESADTTTF